MSGNTSRGKLIVRWLSSLVGIVAIVVYFAWQSPAGFFEKGLHVDLLWLACGFFFYGVFLILSTIRWGNLLSADPTILPWKDLTIVTLIAKGLGSITPMNAGEFYKAELSHRILSDGRGSQYGIVAVERVVDVSTLLLCASIGIFTQPKLRIYFADKVPFVIGIVIVTIAIGIASLYFAVRFSPKLRSLYNGMTGAFRLLWIRKSILPLTILLWLSIAVMWWTLAAAFHANVSFSDALLIMSITTFIIVGSFIPGGLGIADIGATQIGIWLGYPPMQAFLFPLAIRANTFISLLYGVLGWFLRQLKK